MLGHTKFIIEDGKLFGIDTASGFVAELHSKYSKTTAKVSLMEPVEICQTYTVCPSCDAYVRALKENVLPGTAPCCDPFDVTFCTTYWAEVIGGGGGGSGDDGGGYTGTGDGTGGTTGGGGSGGTGWYDGSDPCAGSTSPTPTPRLSTVAPVDGCGSGWTPVNDNPPIPISDDPCLERAEIASREANQTISNINSAIKSYILNNINSTIESGAEHNLKSLSNSNDFMNIQIRSNSQSHTFPPNFTWNPTSGYTIGVSHSHNPAAAPSPADVVWMYGNLSDSDLNASGSNGIDYYKGHISVTAVTLNNTYVISPSSWPELQKAYDSYSVFLRRTTYW